MQFSEKTKLLYLITQSEFGGAQKYVYSLATSISRERYEIFVGCATGGELIRRLQQANIKVFPIPELEKERFTPMKDLSAFRSIWRLIRQVNPTIVHANSTKAGFWGRLAARLAGVPVIIFTAHGFILNEPMGLAEWLLFWAIEFIGVNAGDAIITVSEFDRRTAVQYLILPSSLLRIWNGIEIDSFQNTPALLSIKDPKSDLGISPDDRTVGTVANFYENKGLRYFLQAAARVRRVFPKTSFIIIGDGQARPALEDLSAQLDLKNSIHFLGRQKDVLQWMPFFDVFVLSSLKEGMPFSLLEAMSTARPVVGTAVGGIPEAVIDGKTGILVPPRNPEAIANAIVSLLKNPMRAREMGEAGRKRVLECFTLEKMVKETEAFYQALLLKKYQMIQRHRSSISFT